MFRFGWLSAFQTCCDRVWSSFDLQRPRKRRGKLANAALRGAAIECLECRQLLTAIVVTTNSDAVSHTGKSLRDAIAQANVDASGDTITFSSTLAGKKIVLAQGELTVTGSMTITGLGANQLTIDGNNASRLFNINGRTSQVVTISGLTLQHGNGASPFLTGNGGAVFNGTTLTLANDVISGSSAVRGGGVYNRGVLTSANTIYSMDSAIGGGILNIGTVTSSGDVFSGNSGTFGGGVYNYGTLTATSDTFSGNTATIGGGISNNGTMSITGNVITGNTSTVGGKLRIGTEIVTVTAIISTTRITVLRAQMGTSQINLNGRSVALALDQRGDYRKTISDMGSFET